MSLSSFKVIHKNLTFLNRNRNFFLSRIKNFDRYEHSKSNQTGTSGQSSNFNNFKLISSIGLLSFGIHELFYSDQFLLKADETKDNVSKNESNQKVEKITQIAFPLAIRFGTQNFDIIGEPALKTVTFLHFSAYAISLYVPSMIENKTDLLKWIDLSKQKDFNLQQDFIDSFIKTNTFDKIIRIVPARQTTGAYYLFIYLFIAYFISSDF
jgi:hypothetical protein